MNFYDFVVYAVPEDGADRFVAFEGQVSAESEKEARSKLVDFWDDRLTSSGCTPSVELDEIDLSNWEEFEHIRIGEHYNWLDPDEGTCSKKVVVTGVNTEEVFAKDMFGSEIQCYPDELVPIVKEDGS